MFILGKSIVLYKFLFTLCKYQGIKRFLVLLLASLLSCCMLQVFKLLLPS